MSEPVSPSTEDQKITDSIKGFGAYVAIMAAVSLFVAILAFMMNIQLVRHLRSKCQPFFLRNFIWILSLIVLLINLAMIIFGILVATGVVSLPKSKSETPPVVAEVQPAVAEVEPVPVPEA